MSETGAVKSLDQRIEEKINLLQVVQHDFPAYIIVHDIRDFSVVFMCEPGLKHLGHTLEQLKAMGENYHTYFFNPEDARDYVPKIFALLERNNDDECVSFFQQVRSSPQHDWEWYLSATRIFLRDDDGRPVLTITTATPVDSHHQISTKAQRLLDENNFLRHNHKVFDTLTKREKEILKLIAMGLSSAEIAAQLHLSEATVNTHRKNVKSKLNAKTNYDITRFAQAFDLV
jgi:DNA-binding CsgD family transcriptional regulator